MRNLEKIIEKNAGKVVVVVAVVVAALLTCQLLLINQMNKTMQTHTRRW
jgi:hypothetical protein